MRCSLCRHGETETGRVTVTLERGSTMVIVKEVPAQVCDNCGEYYLDQTVSEQIFAIAEDAVRKNAEVQIVRFAA